MARDENHKRFAWVVRFLRKLGSSSIWGLFLNLIANLSSSGESKRKETVCRAMPSVTVWATAIILTGICHFLEWRWPGKFGDQVPSGMTTLTTIGKPAESISEEPVESHEGTPADEGQQAENEGGIGRVESLGGTPNGAGGQQPANMESQLGSLANIGFIVTLPNTPPSVGGAGSVVLHKNFKLRIVTNVGNLIDSLKKARIHEPSTSNLDDGTKQLLQSMKETHEIDKDATFQLGTYAILKYTDDGLESWKLEEGWTPIISDDISRSMSLLDIIRGHSGEWTIRGSHLQNVTLKSWTRDRVDNFTDLRHETQGGIDVLQCKEPPLAQNFTQMLQRKIYISATRQQKMEDGVTFVVLHSEAINARKAYLISVMKLIASKWVVLIVMGWALSSNGLIHMVHKPFHLSKILELVSKYWQFGYLHNGAEFILSMWSKLYDFFPKYWLIIIHSIIVIFTIWQLVRQLLLLPGTIALLPLTSDVDKSNGQQVKQQDIFERQDSYKGNMAIQKEPLEQPGVVGGAAAMGDHGNVHVIKSTEEWDAKLDEGATNNKVIVVDFTATWCGPCQHMTPIFAELSKKHTKLIFVMVDVDQLKDVAAKWDVQAMPTFIFIKDKKLVYKIVGANKEELERTSRRLGLYL